MKFDQALKEGFDNYVSEDEEKITIGRDILNAIKELVSDNDVIALAVEKHKDNPSLHANICKLYFAIDGLLKPGLLKPAKDEEEITAAGAGGGGVKETDYKYNIDSAVEKEAEQNKGIGAFGKFGTAKYKTNQAAKKAVDTRSKLIAQAVDVYNKKTKGIEQALRNAS